MERIEKHFYEFGGFRIDKRERRLLRDGTPVAVSPKLFDLLILLVENNGHTLAKDVLMKRVWPGTFVEENSLSHNISLLRKLLGDDLHDSRFIKTIPKHGYRFETDVREVVEDVENLVVEKRSRYSVAIRGTWLSPSRIITASVMTLALVAVVAWAAGWRPQGAVLSATSGDRRGTSNAEAFDLYQRGRELWKNRSAAGLHEATLLLEQSVEKDPNFALAHAALADAYAFDTGNWKKAEETARRAIELDPSLGEPYASIGFVKFFWEWNPAGAEVNFKRSISLSPDYSTAHQWYATVLAADRRFNQALAEIGRGLEVEPGSLSARADKCQILYFVERYDEAKAECKKVLEADPRFFSAHLYLQDIYTAKGMYDEAVEEFFTTERLSANYSSLPVHLKKLKTVYDRGGIRAFWRERLGTSEDYVSQGGYAGAKYLALLGENDMAMDAIHQAYERHDFNFPLFAAEPILQKCCSADQRFVELATRWTTR